MPNITVRTFRELLKKKLVKGIGLAALGLVALSMVAFFAFVPPMGVRGTQGTEGTLSERPMLTVGNFTLGEGDLLRLMNLQMGERLPSEYGQQLFLRFQLAQSIGQQIAMTEELKKRGFRASGDEVEKAKQDYLEARMNALKQQLLPEGKGTERDLDKALRERGTSLKLLKERWLAEVPEFLFEGQVIGQKFQKSLEEKYKPTDEQLRLMFERLFPARIYVSVEKHKDKAQARIQQAYEQLKAGKPFAEVVKAFSDDPDPILKQGGRITGSGYYEILDQFTNLFDSATANRIVSLKPGEYTEPLQDKEKKAYYIISIAERKFELPEDFEKNKEGYRKSYTTMRAGNEQQKVFAEALKNFPVKFVDPLLAQFEKYFALGGQPAPERLKALKSINEALIPIIGSADPNIRLAQWFQIQVLQQLAFTAKEVKDAKAEKEYNEQLMIALNRFFSEGGEDRDLRLIRAEKLIEQNQKPKALEDLEIAQALTFNPQESFILVRIADLYEKAGRKDLAQKTRQRAEELRKEQERMIQAQIEAFKREQEERMKQEQAQKEAQQKQQGTAQQTPQTQGSTPTASQPPKQTGTAQQAPQQGNNTATQNPPKTGQ